MKQRNNRFVNNAFTKKIEQLHQKGYIFDYFISANNSFLCVQNNSVLNYKQASIRLVDHFYDKMLMRYCYLHTVDAETGENGILILPINTVNYHRCKKDMSQIIDEFWAAF